MFHSMTARSTAAAIALALAAPAFVAPAFAANPMVGGAEMFPDKTIVENAMNSADHTTLVQAVTAAGLGETLSGEGPFTVFAPTNDAFAKLPAEAVADLMKPENKDALAKVLTCHVVGAGVMAADAVKMVTDGNGKAEVDTVGGCKLTAALDGDKLTLTDENGTVATVTQADVAQSNGVIHVIDTVLMPKM